MTITTEQADSIRHLWYTMDGPSDRPRQVSEWATVVEGLLRIVGEITGIDSAAAISPMEPAAPATPATVILRNEPNNCLVRFPCLFCGGCTEKQSYLFTVPEGGVVCDTCAQYPDRIASRARREAASLRLRAEWLEREVASRAYVTEVVLVPADTRDLQDGMYGEANFAPWMRERLGLPATRTETPEGECIWTD